jgi:hypothetical protein
MKTAQQIEQELRNSGAWVGWQPGMSLPSMDALINSNGAVASSSLGYQYTIQTTTLIRAKVIKQKFYEVPFADYVPVVIGEGAWMENIKTNLVYDVTSPFEAGLQAQAANQTRIETVDVATAPVTATIETWIKGYQYSIPEVEKALASNNWDVIAGKMKALKKNWDLGLQKVSFLGLLQNLTFVPGLLTQPAVNSNAAVITGYISAMNAADFAALVRQLIAAYFANSNSTVMPDTFVIPMQDWLGLGVLVPGTVGTYPVPMLNYLLEAFKLVTMNPGFQIKPVAYADQANNDGYFRVGGGNRYVLYRRDPETIRMDLPVDMFLNPAGTGNNFQWNGVAAGQFTGAIAYRVPELLYFDWHV